MVDKNLPPGLALLKRRDRSYKATVKGLDNCEKSFRRFDDDYGCNNCERKEECDGEFRYQIDTRSGYSWRLKNRVQDFVEN